MAQCAEHRMIHRKIPLHGNDFMQKSKLKVQDLSSDFVRFFYIGIYIEIRAGPVPCSLIMNSTVFVMSSDMTAASRPE